MARKAKELINAATIARVTDKITGKFLGFLVKSDRTNDYYEVTCLKINEHCEFFCNCIGFKSHGHCKHCDACKELVAARKELKKVAPAVETPAPVVAEQTMASGKFHAGMFIGNRGCSVYISDEEMAELKAQVKARKQAQEAMTQAAEQQVQAIEFGQLVTSKRAPVFAAPTFVNTLADLPLNGNQAFSILK